MSYNLTPLEVCERLLGDLTFIARVCGLKPKAPYGWRRGADHRQAGDLPAHAQRKLLQHAQKQHLPLTAEHLIRGAATSEIDAILAARADRDAA